MDVSGKKYGIVEAEGGEEVCNSAADMGGEHPHFACRGLNSYLSEAAQRTAVAASFFFSSPGSACNTGRPSSIFGFAAAWYGCIGIRIRPKKGNHSRYRARIKQAVGLLMTLLLAGLAVAQQASIGSARDLLAKGQLREAAVVLRQVVAAEPGNFDARTLLGTTLALQGIRSESIEQLVEAVHLRPKSAEAYNTLGMVLSRFVETKAAREAFENALALDPNLAEVRINLALLQAQAGEFEPAGENLDRANQLQGDTCAAAYSHYLRARVWIAQEQMRKAESELEIAVKLRPDYVEAWADLGGVRRLDANPEGAQRALERAVALNPDDGTAQYRLGLQCLENGEPHKAIEHLRVALHHEPDDRATLYNLALALRRDGQESEAKSVNDRLSKLAKKRNDMANTGAAGDLNDAGMALEKSGNVQAALEKYRAALQMDPTDEVFRLNYGLALCRLGRWQQGAAELREVLRLDPNNADATKALYIALDHVDRQAAQAGKAAPPNPAQKK